MNNHFISEREACPVSYVRKAAPVLNGKVLKYQLGNENFRQ